MKVAVIGSRNACVDNLERYLGVEVTEIVSGGAKGIDTCARQYALTHHIKLTEFLPDYARYGRGGLCDETYKSLSIPIGYWHFGMVCLAEHAM